MRAKTRSFFGSMMLIGLLIGVATPPPAHAWHELNKLYKCVMQARSTICYEAWTTIMRYPEIVDSHGHGDGGELGQSQEIGAKTNAVYGGGIGFFAPPNTDRKLDTWHAWNYHYSSAEIGHKSWIRPCAPGGPSGWRHQSTHYVLWDAGSPYGYLPIDFRQAEKHQPLPTTTCPEGIDGPIP